MSGKINLVETLALPLPFSFANMPVEHQGKVPLSISVVMALVEAEINPQVRVVSSLLLDYMAALTTPVLPFYTHILEMRGSSPFCSLCAGYILLIRDAT